MPLLAFVASGCAAAGIPPGRAEIGSALARPPAGLATGMRLSGSVNLASATMDEEQSSDVAVGYAYERLEPAGKDIGDRKTPENEDRLLTGHVGFVEYARVLTRNLEEHHRTWLGVRGEYLWASEADGGDGVGVLARATWEIFTPVDGSGAYSDACGGGFGAAIGTLGLGLYAEGGTRWQGDDSVFMGSIGLSVRLPSAFGMGVNWCGD